MKVSLSPQGSPEWARERAGVVTASRADEILTPLFKAKDSKGVDTFCAKLLAEKWIGGPLPEDELNVLPVEFGKIVESEAKPFYSWVTGQTIENVGLITDDSGRVGCSPDGLIGSDCGIEIKCPNHTNHVKYLLANQIPDDYKVQVAMSMWVTGRPRWVFMSYRRNMPALIVKTTRDEEVMAKIEAAVRPFLAKLDAGWKRLVELNGGEPQKGPTVDEILKQQPETFDLPTP